MGVMNSEFFSERVLTLRQRVRKWNGHLNGEHGQLTGVFAGRIRTVNRATTKDSVTAYSGVDALMANDRGVS